MNIWVGVDCHRSRWPHQEKLQAVRDRIENDVVDVMVCKAVADTHESGAWRIKPPAELLVIRLQERVLGDIGFLISTQNQHHVSTVLDVDRTVKLVVGLRVWDA